MTAALYMLSLDGPLSLFQVLFLFFSVNTNTRCFQIRYIKHLNFNFHAEKLSDFGLILPLIPFSLLPEVGTVIATVQDHQAW